MDGEKVVNKISEHIKNNNLNNNNFISIINIKEN